MDARNGKSETSTGFKAVLSAELDLVAARRSGENPASTQEDIYRRARDMKLAALAFSGGGIRSAVFNLGFLQGIANRKALPVFDYLSTVSGGGYVGGWLSALLQRKSEGAPVGDAEVRKLAGEYLATPPIGATAGEDAGFPLPESTPVRFLRRYADYLDPRLGLSGDTLALIALMLRNVVVIQLLLVSMLVTAFSLLLLLGKADRAFAHWEQPVMGSAALLALALLTALWSQSSRRHRGAEGGNPNLAISIGVLLPALGSGVLAAIGLEMAAKGHVPIVAGPWIAVPVLTYGVVWLFTLKCLRAWIGMLGGAVTLGLALYLSVEPLWSMLVNAPFGHAIAFAPPLALALQGLVITVHLALAGSAISEESREWWARAGGQAMLIALAWTLAFCFLLYAPPLIRYGMEWSLAGGGLWVVLTWIGTRLAQGGDTGGKNGNFGKEIIAAVAPWLFLAGLLALVAWAFVATLPWVTYDGCRTLPAVIDAYQRSLVDEKVAVLAMILAGSAVLFLFLLCMVDLNLFSAHSFYLNRLARTFMGASHAKRCPNPFTGFDPKDDMDLADLAGQRPLHLFNANLNLTGGDELAWQTRRGASFVFTPLYSGYSTSTSLGHAIGGYRPTSEYGGGLSLATVVAVSGAAACPNMGFHTSTSVAALLTAFNLRLARWCPNPSDAGWRQHNPTWSAWPLFAELFGEANGRNPWLNLSDGGHFDNLGLYELVRRRAALILVTDVGADGEYRFDDLAMVVRKLSVDFGVRLEIDEAALDRIRPPNSKPGAAPLTTSCFSEKHWAFGRIHYPDAEPGYLIYVKSSLGAEAPIDIRQYRDAHPAFPHESTADQWFDEAQFEAYRHLGQSIAEQLLAEFPPGNESDPAHLRVADLCRRVESALTENERPKINTQPGEQS